MIAEVCTRKKLFSQSARQIAHQTFFWTWDISSSHERFTQRATQKKKKKKTLTKQHFLFLILMQLKWFLKKTREGEKSEDVYGGSLNFNFEDQNKKITIFIGSSFGFVHEF